MFKKYRHIERLGSDEVAGLLDGTCYVFPKIDGTNASVWMDTGQLCAGSRRRHLSEGEDNAGFLAFVAEHTDDFLPFFTDYPDLRLYGEWLVPHTLRTYRKEAWRQFYIFDVYHDAEERYLAYDEYEPLVSPLPFPVIAPLEVVLSPTEEHLVGLLDRNTYLIEDGNGPGEGIVIKRYGWENEWGETVWGKLVKNEFKERNLETFGAPTVAMKQQVELAIATEYVTRGRVEKALAKMRDAGPLTRKRIPELLGRVWHDIVADEMWDIVKKHKFPTVDFKRLYGRVIEETKRNCPELF